jgi:hypothetical protein
MHRRLVAACALTALALSILSAAPASAAIGAPELLAPNDGTTLTYPTQPPLFRWKPVTGAATYRIEVDDAPDFIGATSATTVNTAYALTEPQTIGQPFYWHVEAITANGKASNWSVTSSYEISWPDSQPSLVTPANGSSVEDIVFSWDPVPGAATYQIQVSPNGDWANNVSIDAIVKGTRYSPTTTLDNASYFWRVRGRDAASSPNLGTWSAEWQFTRHWLDAPDPATPADTLSPSVETPTFSWTPIDHASHYEVQVGTDVNFSPTTFSTCFTNHTEVTYHTTVLSTGPSAPGGCSGTDLTTTPGDVYYWRVRGVDAPADANSLWSATGQFLFRSESDDIPTLVSPGNGDTVETPALEWEAVPDIEQYKVTIEKPGGSTVTVTTAATSWTPTTLLGSMGPFQWYVQTVDSYGELGVVNGSPWTFSLTDPTTSPAPPTLLTPANASHSTRMPSMTWTPVDTADYYEVWYSVQGSGVEQKLSGSTKLRYAGFTYAGDPLAPATYTWRVKAFDSGNALIGTPSASRSFTIDTIGTATYEGPCSTALTPCTVKDTPTLSWGSVDDAGLYLVYLAQDVNFSNIIKTYQTQYTTLTPRESLLDNQAGNSYYWFVRPCVTETRCGRFDDTVFDEAFAFHKSSKAIVLTSPTNGAIVPNLVTFAWTDFVTTNLADPDSPTQEAKQYRIQVSTVADFATILDDKTVDQTTYTPFDKTYPEGTLYWRVQAIDGSGNALTQSTARSVVKTSPKISLQFPAADVKLVANLPYFSWDPQDYAARYELEVYQKGDTNFSPSNRVLDQLTKMAAWAPTQVLETGSYAWRIRRLDADGKPGPWSLGRKFSIARASTTTTVKVSKVNGKIKASGTLKPAHPGRTMKVTLFRKQSGSFAKITTKTPTIGTSGGFATTFARPAAGTCKVVAAFPGDSDHKPSSDSVVFPC